jgi:outer membrane protein assembly factor BamB
MKMEAMFSRDRLKFFVFLLAACFFAPHASQAEVTEAWVRRYNSVATNSYERGGRVVIDKAGDVIVAGVASGLGGNDHGMITIKYSGKNGSLIWKRVDEGKDEPRALTIDDNNNVVITGQSAGDFYTAKYAASNGAVLWERRFNGTANGSDVPRGVATDRHGNVIVGGHSALTEFYTAKYAADDGAILWERRVDEFAGSLDHGSVAVDNNGDVLIAVSRGGFATLARSDYYVAKYAATNGATLWEQRYNNPVNSSDYPFVLALDPTGNAIVAGTTYGASSTPVFHVIKYAAADGSPVWEQHIPQVRVAAVLADAQGDVVLTGYVRNPADETDTDYYTAKYAATDGALLWEKRYDGPAHPGDFVQGLALDASGNAFIAGYSYNRTNSTYGYATIKYAAADGAPLWERSGILSHPGFPESAVTDAAGNLIVGGSTDTATESWNIRIEKYDGVTGASLWQREYNHLAHGNDQPRAIAIDRQNNVIVTGTLWNSRDNVSYTAKYAAAGGGILWERQYDGLLTSSEVPAALVLDAEGNVFVSGIERLFRGTVGSSSTTTVTHVSAKYASADGTLLWQKIGPAGVVGGAAVLPAGDLIVVGALRSNTIPTSTSTWHVARYNSLDGALVWEKSGPQGSASAVVVDPFGNIIVTGGAETRGDFYTVKYRADDATVIWEQRYIGSGHTTSGARALGVDLDGNVAVTGLASNSGGLHFYTAKYRAADGFPLWERNYSSGTNSEDSVRALAVDRQGNVVVAGSLGNGTNYNAYTAKYAARDGGILWEVIRPAATAEAVAIDDANDVIVAGNSHHGTAYYRPVSDYHTAKYAGTDGALLWEKHYGSSNWNDVILTSRNLAVGTHGVIAVTGAVDTDPGPGFWSDIVTVVYCENLPPVAIERLPSAVRVRFAAISGRVYRLQRAHDINGPWVTLSTETASADGMLEYLDSSEAANSTFYRVRMD